MTTTQQLLVGALFWVQVVSYAFAQTVSHPVLETLPGRLSTANRALSDYTEAEYLSNFVPRQTPRREPGFTPIIVPGDTSWSWNENEPHFLTSLPSGTRFPGAAGYPVRFESVRVMDGSTLQVPYYTGPGSSRKSLVHAQIDGDKSVKVRRDLLSLAFAYMESGDSHATRNQAYARRIAAILYEWSLEFPRYFMTELNRVDFIDYRSDFVADRLISRASTFNGYFQEWLNDEIHAFDAIYDSLVWDEIDADRGTDVKQAIIDNFFTVTGDFFINHVPPSVAAQANLPDNNMVMAKVAHVLHRPDYINWVNEYMAAATSDQLMRDSTISEGMGYSQGFLFGLKITVDAAVDYFSSRPANTSELMATQVSLNGYEARLNQGIGLWEDMALPTGVLPSLGDTDGRAWFAPKSEVKSTLVPAFGAVALGTGADEEAVLLSQNFSGDNNHMRSDTTAFTLWAFGREMVSNFRYHNRAAGRQLGEQMLSHNSVTIDRSNATLPSANTYGTGDITLYEPGNEGLALTEIDGERAYENEADRYQRLMLLNTEDLARPYVVDVFRVTGGRTHDYTFHAPHMYDTTWESSFPLARSTEERPLLEGNEVWRFPTDRRESFNYYGVWERVSQGQTNQDFQVTYRDDADSNRDVRLWMTSPGDTEVSIGETPVPARFERDKHQPSFWELGLWRPSSIIRRRTSSGTLNSLFVSVIEPMKGEDNVVSVERLPMQGSAEESCAIRVTLNNGRVDTYLINLRNPLVADGNRGSQLIATADGEYQLDGRVGYVSERPEGKKVWTMGATSFVTPEQTLETPGSTYSGRVIGATRSAQGNAYNSFVTDANLPEGDALRGQFILLNFGTLSRPSRSGIDSLYEIDRVARVDGRSRVVLKEDHYLRFSGDSRSDEQTFPYRRFNGTHRFQISQSVSAGSISGLEGVEVAVGSDSGLIPFSVEGFSRSDGSSLQVSARAADRNLIPDSGVTISGTGTNRSLRIRPAAGRSGGTELTVTVSDGNWTRSQKFPIFVGNGPASISEIQPQMTGVNETLAVPFHVSDWATVSEQLATTVSSSNSEVVASAGLVLIEDHQSMFQNRVLEVTPVAGATGTTVISVAVDDGVQVSRQDFLLIVRPAFDSSGRVAHWPLDEGRGSTTADVSGLGNHGTLLNDPTWSGDQTRGSFVEFDGDDDRIATTFRYGLSSDRDFTWAWWANKQTPAGVDNGAVMIGNRYPEHTTGNRFGFVKMTPIRAEFANAATSGGIVNHNYPDLLEGQWHHYAMVKSGNSYRWYVDGVQTGSPSTLQYDEERQLPFFIGGDDNGTGKSGEHFKGFIDDVVLYDRALSRSEVRDVRNGIYEQVVTLVGLGGPSFWDVGDDWSDGRPAHDDAAYIVPATGDLRSETGNATFPSDQLIIMPGARKQIRSRESLGEVTVVPNLILQGGTAATNSQAARLTAGFGTSETNVLDGKITQSGYSRIETFGGSIDRSLRILAQVSGSGVIQAWQGLSQGGANLSIENSANSFSGTWEVGAQSTLSFTSAGAVGPADISVLDSGKLEIRGDWVTEGSLMVADSSATEVRLDSYIWSVGDLTVGTMMLADGVYTVADLNGLSLNPIFSGTGGIRVGNLAAEGPVAQWRFNEGSGLETEDASGLENQGFLNNGTAWGSDEVRSSYLSFDGTDDYVQTPVTIDMTSPIKDFTWALWANNQAEASNGVIVGNRGPDINGSLNFLKLTSRKLDGVLGGGNQGINIAHFPPGEWHHHAVVKEGSSLSYYRDGSLVTSRQLTTFADGVYPFHIGGDPSRGSQEFFQGFIDDVFVYRRALSLVEIIDLMDLSDRSELENWRVRYFGESQGNGNGADSADANDDGESNFLEFATAQDPHADTRATATMQVAADMLQFRYRRGKAALSDGVTFQVEWSDTLESNTWSASGVIESVEGESAEEEEVMAEVPMNGRSRFVRLRVRR